MIDKRDFNIEDTVWFLRYRFENHIANIDIIESKVIKIYSNKVQVVPLEYYEEYINSNCSFSPYIITFSEPKTCSDSCLYCVSVMLNGYLFLSEEALMKSHEYYLLKHNCNPECMSRFKIQNALSCVTGTFAVEGIELTETTLQYLRRVADGEDCETILEEIKAKYAKTQ